MARRSELAALTAHDVDLGHATITISKQVDRKKKTATKKTKTRRTRTIDIEPNLLPLIERLAKEVRTPTGRLLHMPPAEDCAELLRKDLWTVGARDDRLHTEDATRTMMVFHCLRDSGLTHMAVRGDSPIVIQWRGGHTDFKTTQGYIDRGRVEARRIGEPLPPLPPDLCTPAPSSPQRDPAGSARVLPQGKTPDANVLETLVSLRPQRELRRAARSPAALGWTECSDANDRWPGGALLHSSAATPTGIEATAGTPCFVLHAAPIHCETACFAG